MAERVEPRNAAGENKKNKPRLAACHCHLSSNVAAAQWAYHEAQQVHLRKRLGVHYMQCKLERNTAALSDLQQVKVVALRHEHSTRSM